MKLGRLTMVLGSTAAVLLAVACSSSSSDDSGVTGTDSGTGTDTSTGGGDGGPPKDSGGGSCKNLEDGSYTLHYSGPDGGPGCPPADSQFTVGGGDAGDAGSSLPPGCTSTTSSSTCAVTVHCDINSGGYDTVIDIVETPNAAGNGGTGTYSTTTTQPDGGPFSSCTGVTFTMTKN